MKNKENKIRLEVTWPTSSHFTFTQLLEINPAFKKITLRVRLTNSIKNGKVVEIGSIHGSIGAPLKIYTMAPVTKTVLDKAKSDENIVLNSNIDKPVGISINPPQSQVNINPVKITGTPHQPATV